MIYIYNLFEKKKCLSFISKGIGTQSDDAHVHSFKIQGLI